MSRDEFISRWAGLHGEPHLSKIVKAWLHISFSVAGLATKLRFSPNAVTLLGVAFAALASIKPVSLWAAFFIVLSLLSDGIDGSISILQNRSSKWGSLLDSLGDRISEVFWFYIVYEAGAPLWASALLWIFSAIAEYARARIAGLGIFKIDVVTLTERPTRASLTFILLLGALFNMGWVAWLIYPYLIIQIFSIFQIMKSSYRALQEQQSQN